MSASLLLVVPMLLATAPSASATALEGCSTDPSDYHNHRQVDDIGGHFEQWWNFNTPNNTYCVLIHIKDSTSVASNCYDGMFDFGNPNHYDSRQFISCDQGTLKVVSYKDNEAGKQNNTADTDFGSCVRLGGTFGNFDTPCDWVVGGGGGVDGGTKWPKSPSSPNADRGDFITWGGAGNMTCYDDGSQINCNNFANV